MRKFSVLALTIGLCLALDAGVARSAPAPSSADHSREPAVLVDISGTDRAGIERLKPAAGEGWWLELGDSLLVAGDTAVARARLSAPVVRELGTVAPGDLVLHARGCAAPMFAPSLVFGSGRSYQLLRRTESTQSQSHAADAHLGAAEWIDVVPNTVIARRYEPDASGLPAPDPYIVPIVASVDASRWFGDVSALAAFDRSSFSTELAAARGYIAQQFSALGLEVTEPEFQFTYNGTTANVRNVIGRWTGTRRPDDWTVVGGHYDSRQQNIMNPVDTPGADDNASGCSGVIEAARVLTRFRPQSTILFMCYAGEEQWLYGSTDHVNSLVTASQIGRVSRMFNMDMIGWSASADIGVILESSQEQSALVAEMSETAAVYVPELDVMQDFAPCCSDHMPYLNAGRPSILSIHKGDAFAYPFYHRTTDLPANMGPHAQAVGGAIIRLNVATVAQWSDASDLVFADSYDD